MPALGEFVEPCERAFEGRGVDFRRIPVGLEIPRVDRVATANLPSDVCEVGEALGSSGVRPARGAEALTDRPLLSQVRHAKRTKCARVAASRELAEDAVSDAPLALDEEVNEVVRKEGVVAGRRI